MSLSQSYAKLHKKWRSEILASRGNDFVQLHRELGSNE